MTPPVAFPTVDLGALAPALVVGGTAAVVLLLDLLPPRDSKEHLGAISLAGVVGAVIVTVWLWLRGVETRAFRDMVVLDAFALFFAIVVGYAAGLALLISIDYIRRHTAQAGEYYALLLLATTGMMLLASANDLIVVFLALELMSLSLYVLAGLFKQRLDSGEASMKYFLLGAFASPFLLYGIALVYGATGATNLDRIAASAAARDGEPLLLLGLALLLVGFGFKISSVPFHMWAPDVYDGAPSAITAYMAATVKAAAFAAFLRVFLTAFAGVSSTWTQIIFWLAILTMIAANLTALVEGNVKRMLAYSSIAHAGFILTGLTAAGATGIRAALFYLVAYAAMTVGAFGTVMVVSGRGEERERLEDYACLGRTNPLAAALMTLFLLSLAGIPPTAGFIAKVNVFSAAIEAGNWDLVMIGVLASVAAAFFYLRVIVLMYMQEPADEPAPERPVGLAGPVLAVAAAATLALGVFPGLIVGVIREASVLTW